MLDALLDRSSRAASSQRPRAGLGVGRVESPRGATVCVVERTTTASGAYGCARLIRQLAVRGSLRPTTCSPTFP